jgi:hypothetical protein
MWTLKTTPASKSTISAVLHEHDASMTFADVVRQWGSNAAFRASWSASLRMISFAAYCWETPPLTNTSMHRPFECVFVESPALVDAQADAVPFAEHFGTKTAGGAVLFKSLGGDAMLVAPCPGEEKADYAHLAAFVRTAPATQSSALWQVVADGLERRIGAIPVWLSTAGLGVAWLHVRLDSRPKYYRHRAYASQHFWGGSA